jgi:FkbM family methyltransferase
MIKREAWQMDSIYEFMKAEFGGSNAVNIIEIGAHMGTDTERLATFVRSGRMISFEPDPRNLPVLRDRMRGSNVEIIDKAVSAAAGKASFYLSSGGTPDGQHTASSSLLPPKNHLTKFPWVRFDDKVDVDVVTLDSCWGDKIVDLVWADVQGAEMGMIKGGLATLANTKFLFTEFNDGEMYEGQRGLFDLMDALPGQWGIVRIFGDEVLFQNMAFGSEHIRPAEPLTIVMQGPVLPYTDTSVASIREWFPSAELLFSTWCGENTDGLDVDGTVWTTDPGPGSEYASSIMRGNLARMVVGSYNGIINASNDLVMKVRSDTIFTGNGCLRHIRRWPKRSPSLMSIFEDRIIVPNIGTADPDVHVCFQVSDWVLLGKKSDVISVFSCPLGDDAENPPISPEQYIWLHAIKRMATVPSLENIDHKTPELVQATKDFMSNNLVILDTRAQFNFYGGKYEHLPDDQGVNMRHSKWATWYGKIL